MKVSVPLQVRPEKKGTLENKKEDSKNSTLYDVKPDVLIL
jgi:hypothetical protein